MDKLKKKFSEVDILDLSLVEKGWNSKEGKWDPKQHKLVMKEMDLWLRGLMNPQEGARREIALVSHSSWITEFLKRHGIPCTFIKPDNH